MGNTRKLYAKLLKHLEEFRPSTYESVINHMGFDKKKQTEQLLSDLSSKEHQYITIKGHEDIPKPSYDQVTITFKGIEYLRTIEMEQLQENQVNFNFLIVVATFILASGVLLSNFQYLVGQFEKDGAMILALPIAAVQGAVLGLAILAYLGIFGYIMLLLFQRILIPLWIKIRYK